MPPEPAPALVSSAGPRLLDQLRGRIRVKHYSIRTEQAYVDWVRRFILFHGKSHPRALGAAEVEAFLTHLAVRRQVSASTQNQAKSAILFLYKEVIDKELPWLNGVVAARVSQHLPVVLSVDEVNTVLGRMRGTSALVARLLYGSGLRILECLRLRVKDIDFANHQILVRDGKGAKDRVTMLPESLVEPLQRHLERVRELHARRSGRRLRFGVPAPRAGSEVPERWQGLDVAVRLPLRAALEGPALWRGQTPSCGREANPACAAVGAARSCHP
jgi:site-specific recombinase XerD